MSAPPSHGSHAFRDRIAQRDDRDWAFLGVDGFQVIGGRRHKASDEQQHAAQAYDLAAIHLVTNSCMRRTHLLMNCLNLPCIGSRQKSLTDLSAPRATSQMNAMPEEFAEIGWNF